MNILKKIIIIIFLEVGEAGKIYHIVDEGGNSTINNILIVTSGVDTINGDTSTIIDRNYQSISLYGTANENKWFFY